MPLHFSLVCQLLDECERLCSTGKSNSKAVSDWFSHHRPSIHTLDVDLCALLSTLLPEKRTDRVYCIQVPSLEKIIARALMLGSSRVSELARYKQPGLGLDLADCVERILKSTPNPVSKSRDRVTVEELDALLNGLASASRWSSPAIRRSHKSVAQGNRGDIERIYRRLEPREAKWFTRLILKNFQPVILDSNVVFTCCHPLLPSMVKIQDDFAAAIRMLRHVKGDLLRESALAALADRTVLLPLKPQVGIKVGRQNWLKARSIKHCFNLGHGRMSIEEKIDGEYCQVHVDVTAKRPLVQIFSKSGKDSTEDRRALHGAIYESLRIGRPGCNFRSKCILEGELVVYSHRENKILPFHRIRNHVTRRGLFMNIEGDTRPDASEQLMIIYFDILLIDDRSLLDVRRCERFKLLQQTAHAVKGIADFVPRQVVDFGHPYAVSELRKAFAQVIVARGEGLVLKPDDPYFNFHRHDLPFAGHCIKFKKEYIGNLGDVGDFAVVGAGFDASKAKTYNIPNLQWTHFYLGCLDNKEQVLRWNAVPAFTVVAVVELNASQLKTVMSCGFPSPIRATENEATRLKIPKGIETGPPMLVTFGNPLVFDIRCFSFDKPGNTGFWTLRFPCVSKIHFDRDFRDTVSFDELQTMAQSATTVPEADDSQENLDWIARLEEADPRRLPVDAATQLTDTTISTPSPAKSTQVTSQRGSRASPIAISDDEDVSCEGSPRSSAKPLVLSPFQQVRLPSGCLRKRSTPLFDNASQTRKRHRSREPEEASRPAARHGSRRPLLDLSGNMSTLREATVSEVAKPVISHQVDENACGSDVEAFRTQKPVFQERNSAQGGVARVRDREAAYCSTSPSKLVKLCTYAASDCKLTACTILVSSASIIDDAEPAALLKAHGVLGSVTLADAWLKAAKEPEAGREDTTHQAANKHEAARDGSKLLLLVDTIGPDAAESKALVARIDKKHSDLPQHLRKWITVYDWRVLRNISIAEDESRSSRGNFDGFSDPWRRWQCGYC
ncbi:hypothetical protein L249_2062 [Ophiocordyceps polyrhachis-furcata BCC 54312]|uniref:ATP-dependent DNA ligase family profile domain-containing protein n=1 Tax=Ophiocordyceps polyrhachis-furcata BCC 54312 TaxID=1330021 RepID=A0A367LNC9_9HYPO|nr:hypothetical protein L249_2062 [Ophiocordyceps polyrhachis-furcata BCC 54312]